MLHHHRARCRAEGRRHRKVLSPHCTHGQLHPPSEISAPRTGCGAAYGKLMTRSECRPHISVIYIVSINGPWALSITGLKDLLGRDQIQRVSAQGSAV